MTEVETTEVQPVVNDPAATLGTAVQATLSNTAMSRDAKTEALQAALNTYAGTVKAQLDAVAPPPPGEEMAQAFKAIIQPLVDQVGLMNAKLGSAPVAPVGVPQQKSFVPSGPVQPQVEQELPISPITGKPSALRAIVERGVIGH